MNQLIKGRSIGLKFFGSEILYQCHSKAMENGKNDKKKSIIFQFKSSVCRVRWWRRVLRNLVSRSVVSEPTNALSLVEELHVVSRQWVVLGSDGEGVLLR